jgi:Lon protease-like protein
MNQNTRPNSLPPILSIFPLTGTLLLPGTRLPLHIFEQRYRNMVEDALARDGVFGMIQPIVPQQDNFPRPGAENSKPELYDVGCAGYIERWEKAPDGRYLIQLQGLSRFRVKEELALERGYRRVRPDYSCFPDTTADEVQTPDRARLRQALEVYGGRHGLTIDLKQIDPIPDSDLVNVLGVALPFHATEKQALLEASSLEDREQVLITLLELGGEEPGPDSDPGSRTLN